MSVFPQIPNHGLDLRGSTMLNREILEISPVCPHCHSHPCRLLRLLGSGQWHEKLKVPFLSCFLRFVSVRSKHCEALLESKCLTLLEDIDSQIQMRACWVTAFEAIGMWDSNKHFSCIFVPVSLHPWRDRND